MKKLRLIGFPLSHSFSKQYFTEKFEKMGLMNEFEYSLFPLENIDEFPALLNSEPSLIGLNVTIPHKISVINYLDELNDAASEIGAVNTIKISISATGKKYLKGYNTDVFGFEKSLMPLLEPHNKRAMILGTGGASKAVQFVLKKLNIPFIVVSRNAKPGELTYSSIDGTVLQAHEIIINTSPVGMFPNIDASPEIPYKHLTKNHLLYDLVYNPEETKFLQLGKQYGAHIKGGLEMLQLQAEKAWEIWNEND